MSLILAVRRACFCPRLLPPQPLVFLAGRDGRGRPRGKGVDGCSAPSPSRPAARGCSSSSRPGDRVRILSFLEAKWRRTLGGVPV